MKAPDLIPYALWDPCYEFPVFDEMFDGKEDCCLSIIPLAALAVDAGRP